MKSRTVVSVLLVSGLLLGPLSAPEAGELPPPGSLPLSTILRGVEERALGTIAEAEFDDGRWEVKVCDAGTCQKLYIDPASGEEKRRRRADPDEVPPANAMHLSAVVRSVEAREPGVITEVEFDDGYWEVELRRDGRKVKPWIDPTTGALRR